MSSNIFTQKLNPLNGTLEWQPQDEKYDYHQEIARSAYADMLHDTERNKKYYQSLRKTIKHLKSKGISTNVLDIGTGTGLLSMMAAQCGADSIMACEAFEPIANCAKQVIKNNGFADKIKLIGKRSTELTVGPDGDMPVKANILVTELFDTELIGEGAIPSFMHAHEHLLEKNCYVIPTSATIFAQVIESDFVMKWHRFNEIKLPNGTTIAPSKEMTKCLGAASVHDSQLNQFSLSDFHALTNPIPVLKFDFTGKIPIKKLRDEFFKVKPIQNGSAHAIFMWWELQMDFENSITLSCAPKWARPDGVEGQWRDHWMQAVYFLPKCVEVFSGQDVTLQASHDEFSLWFNLENKLTIENVRQDSPVCDCGAHVAFSRSRFGMVNDEIRKKSYVNALQQVITKDSICLSLSDGSFLPFIAARLGAKKVFSMDSEPLSRRVMESVISHNKLDILVFPLPVQNVFGNNIFGSKVNVLMGEPYFINSILPWDNIRFWYLRTMFALFLEEDVKIMPYAASLKAVALELTDLWKIKAPVGMVEGFNIDVFDKIICLSSDISDETIEPHPLWEYPGKALTEPWEVMSFNFTKKMGRKNVESKNQIRFQVEGSCNAIALWIEWKLDEKNIVSSGPIAAITPGKVVVWDRYARQGVHFFPTPIPNVDSTKHLQTRAIFNPNTGEMQFKFDIETTV